MPHYRAAVILTMLLAGCGLRAAETDPTDPWNEVDRIVARIKTPTFPERRFVLTDFGARGDGKTDCRPAFVEAISVCSRSGGGVLVVPPGTYRVASLFSRSST